MRKRIPILGATAVILAGLMGCGSGENGRNIQEPETIQSEPVAEVEESGEESTEEVTADIGIADDTVKVEEISDDTDDSHLLVAYFSRADENYNVGFIEKGNTAILAEMVAEITGGDLFEIETVTPYPADYSECTDVAKQEQNENARPELAGAVENMDQYAVCYLCYPIWWGDLPMPVYSFLDGYDWDGKTIITVNTHEGSGKAGTPDKISNYLPNATVVDGIAMTGSTAQNSQDEAREQVEEWLNTLNY